MPPITPALRRRLQKCFEHGTNLMKQEKYDHDYANTMLTECIANDPGNLTYVEVFFENLQRKHKKNKKRVRLKGFGGKGNLKKLASKKDWMGVIRAGLDYLKKDPWDVTSLRAMAEACQKLGLNEVELRYLKNALDANPKNPEVNRHCAKSLSRMGQFDMAIACWHRVEENSRGDREAANMISELTLEKNRSLAGFGEPVDLSSDFAEQNGTSNETGVPTSSPTNDESPTPVIERTPRQQIEAAITEDPTVVENYVQLAKFLVREGRFAEAEQTLQKGLAASGGDIAVQEKLEDIQIARVRAQLVVAERQATEQNTDENQKLAADLKSEIVRREIEIFDSRSQRYPENLRFKYELGIRLKHVGKFDLAVKMLQATLNDDHYTATAQLALGECWQHLKEYQKAMQSYSDSARTVGESTVLTKVKLRALYQAGRLAIGLKDIENGGKYLKNVLAMDPGYKDARAWLDKIEKTRHK